MSGMTYDIKLKMDAKGYLVAVNQATGETKKLSESLTDIDRQGGQAGTTGAAGMLKFAAAAGAVFVAVKAVQTIVVGLAKASIQSAAGFETMRTRLETFTGSVDSAASRIEELATIAANTPNSLESILDTEIQLRAFGGALLATNQNLLLVGDAAAAVGQPINEIGNWFGRAYTAIQDGKPLGEVFNRLRELGLATPGVSDEIERLQKAGADANEVWSVFSAQFERFTGSMERQAGTFNGLVSTMKDNWVLLLSEIGDNGPLQVAKTTISEIIEIMQEVQSDGAKASRIGYLIAEGMIFATDSAIKFLQATAFISKSAVVAGSTFSTLTQKVREWTLALVDSTISGIAPGLFFLTALEKSVTGQTKLFGGLVGQIGDFRSNLKGAVDILGDQLDEQNEAAAKTFENIVNVENALGAMRKRLSEAQRERLAQLKEEGAEVEKQANAAAEAVDKIQTGSTRGTVDTVGGSSAIAAILGATLEYSSALVEANKLIEDNKTAEERRAEKLETVSQAIEKLQEVGATATPEFEKLAELQQRLLYPEPTESKQKTFIEQLEEQLYSLEDLTADIYYSFADMFQGIISGSVSAKDAIKGMYQSMIASLAQYVAERIAKAIFANTVEAALNKQNAAQNIVGTASDLTRASAAIYAWAQAIPFGGAAIAQAYIAQMMTNMAATKALATAIPAFAQGGIINPISGGQVILAGEAGERELIAPEKNFMQWANEVTGGGASGGPKFETHVHGSIISENDFMRMHTKSQKRLARSFAR